MIFYVKVWKFRCQKYGPLRRHLVGMFRGHELDLSENPYMSRVSETGQLFVARSA